MARLTYLSHLRSKCPECMEIYTPIRRDQVYCRRSCNMVARNREACRGALIYALAMRWRADRGQSQAYLKGLCRLLSKFRQEDVDAGRPLPRLTKDHLGCMA